MSQLPNFSSVYVPISATVIIMLKTDLLLLLLLVTCALVCNG